MIYRCSKTYGHDAGLSCAFRQWRAASHCSHLHGYALAFRLDFEATELDVNGWVLDFGALKDIKALLVDAFDHRTLVASDDPMLPAFEEMAHMGCLNLRVVDRVGCEAFASWTHRQATAWLRETGLSPRVSLFTTEVREHGANGAIVAR